MTYPHAERRAKPKGLTFDKTVNVSSLLAIIGLLGTVYAGISANSRQSQKWDDWKEAQDLARVKQDAQISKLDDTMSKLAAVQTQSEKNAAVLTQIVMDMKEKR